MERVTVATTLPAPAPVIWATVQRRETFVHITGAMLRFPAAERHAGTWRPGDRIAGWLLLFRVIPVFNYTIEVETVDDGAMTLVTIERGGFVRTWRHTIVVEPLDGDLCRYEDQIDIDAGRLTRLVSAFARIFYSYRQRRWVRLAVLLAAAAEAPREMLAR